MPYEGLGQRMATGTSTDNINWTVTFDMSVLNVSTTIPYFEVYHIRINGVPGSTVDVKIQAWDWDTTNYGDNNSWDPNQPMLVQPGQTIYFYYTYPSASTSAPTVTLWLRYDESLLKVT